MAPIPRAVKRTHISDLAGPSPFPGTTNAAAHAMAMVHTRAQQPQGELCLLDQMLHKQSVISDFLSGQSEGHLSWFSYKTAGV